MLRSQTIFLRRKTFYEHNCSFFGELLTMMTALSSFIITMQLVRSKASPVLSYPEDKLDELMGMPFRGYTINEMYVYVPYTPLKEISGNQQVEEITFNVYENVILDTANVPGTSYVRQPYNFQQNIIGTSFVSFYERVKDDIEAKFGTNTTNWPAPLNFIRVIRNAFAHGGVIHFTNPNALPVVWRTLTYSPSDNGRDIRNDIYLVEVIELMEELENAIR